MTTAAHTQQDAADRPTLAIVKDNAPTPVEGTVVEHQGAELAARPAWLTTVYDHARDNRLYVPQIGRGYLEMVRRWFDNHRDDWPQQIATARADLKAAKGDSTAEMKARTLVQQYRAEYRRHRLIHLGKSTGWTVTASTAAVAGAATGGILFDLGLALTALGIGAWKGRPPAADTNPLTAADNAATALVAPGTEGQIMTLAHVHTAADAARALLGALQKENIPVAEVFDVEKTSWGWQATVRVTSGTPETIIKAAGGLETTLDLPTNGVRIQPLLERRSCAILRLVQSNPFASAPGMPYRAPKSLSITDKSRIGTAVSGSELSMALAGVMGLVVAASGGGKTGLLQAVGEVTTAARDNITIDLDPHGDGLEDLHDAVRVTARSHDQIEATLLFLLMLSKGRARLRVKLGMGKKWKISPEHPSITVIFDEFPKASELAKRLAFDLLLVGRKEAVTVIIASQGGTKLYLGENIAQMIAWKAVGPCKVGDTRAVFGDGAVGEGWLPHRLSPATDTDPKDAGHIYTQGVPGRPDEPIEYAVHEAPSAQLKKLAAERREAGLIEPDQASLDAMATVDLPDYVEPEYDINGNLKREAPVELLSWGRLLHLCDAQPTDIVEACSPTKVIVAAAADVMRHRGVDRMRTEPLAEALRSCGYPDLTADDLKQMLREAGAGSPVPLGEMDGMANPRGFKLTALTSPGRP